MSFLCVSSSNLVDSSSISQREEARCPTLLHTRYCKLKSNFRNLIKIGKGEETFLKASFSLTRYRRHIDSRIASPQTIIHLRCERSLPRKD